MEASASAQASRAAPPVSPRAPKPESPPDPTPSHQPVAALTVQVPPSASSSSLQAVRSSSSGVLGEPLPGIGAGTGAVAHVYAADVGVTLQNETVDAIHYDDATQLLMVVKGGVVFAYDLAMDAPGHHEQLVWTYPLQEGPRVNAMRCSLDQQVLGCLRGGMLLELVELTSGVTTVYKAERADLLGFFFTEAPGADVVLVGRSGLELCEFAARRRGLRSKERLKVSSGPGGGAGGGASWYLWTHETRCCVMAMGPPGAQCLQAWQFVTGGVLTLPPFMVAAAAAPPSPLSPRHVRLLKLYGRVYCAYVNVSTLRLELYRFYTDTVSLQHVYELFSTNVDLSVVDHVLIVHHLDTAITVLIDVAADAADMPIANPLPLAVLCPPPPPPRAPLPPAPLSPPPFAPVAPSGGGGGSAVAASPTRPLSPAHAGPRSVRSSGSKELTHWEFIMPSTVIDRGHQAVYRLYLDLRAVADSCGSPVLLASFLQRRRSPPLPELAVAPKQLLLAMLRGCLQEQLPPGTTLRRVFQQVCRAYADVSAIVSRGGGRASPAAAAAVLTLDEVSVQLFGWLRQQQQAQQAQQQTQQQVQGQPLPDMLYLQTALSEFQAVAAAAGLAPPASLLALQLELLLLQGRTQQADLTVLCMGPQPAVGAVATVARAPSPPVVAGTVGGMGPGEEASAASQLEWLRRVAADRMQGTGASARAVVAAASAAPSAPASSATSGEPSASAASASAASAPAAGAAGGKASSAGDALLLSLLQAGNVVQAARVAKRLRLTSVHPSELLRAAAERRDEVAFVSVYRCFRDALLPLYPHLDSARTEMLW